MALILRLLSDRKALATSDMVVDRRGDREKGRSSGEASLYSVAVAGEALC